jgi:hypothetical protein
MEFKKIQKQTKPLKNDFFLNKTKRVQIYTISAHQNSKRRHRKKEEALWSILMAGHYQ